MTNIKCRLPERVAPGIEASLPSWSPGLALHTVYNKLYRTFTNSVSTLLQLVYNHLLARQAGRRLLLEKEKEKIFTRKRRTKIY